MPLTPPPNYSAVFAAIAVGASVALVVGLLTRNTLPIVGDLQHNLPHGGHYKDGTKTVNYFRPCKLNSVEGRGSFGTQPWFLVIVLSIIIFALGRRANVCPQCGRHH